MVFLLIHYVILIESYHYFERNTSAVRAHLTPGHS